jgi:hypothetical protein
MSLDKFMALNGMPQARQLAEKRWGYVKEPTWKIVCRLALMKKLNPNRLRALIASTEHPGDLFVK